MGSRNSVLDRGPDQTWNWVTFRDPVTRESSDPETLFYKLQLSSTRVMLQTNVCNGQEVWQFLSLSGVCTLLESKILKIIYSVSIFQWRSGGFSQKYISLSWAFFRKPEKLGSHTGSEWWPGDPHVNVDPYDPVTQWPSSMSGQDPLGMEHFRWTAMRLFAELLWTLVRCYTVWKLMLILRRRSVCKAESAVRVCDLLPRLCITV